MKELKKIETGMVPVYETSTGEHVVYGTELHGVLEVKSNYRDWIKNRLNGIDAIEHEDYESAKILAPSGQKKKEHIIKLDTAKEMAMLERNEKGKQVSRYLNAIEQGKDMDNNDETKSKMTQEAQEEIYKSGSVQYLDSREVAEIVEKKHGHLTRDIRQYIKELTQSNFGFTDFFIESAYKDASGKSNKCYLVTRKGCEFIAHKLTGIKGTKFTATYINRFHEMEDALTTQITPALQQFMERQARFNQEMLQKINDVQDRRDANVTNLFTLNDFLERKEKLNDLVNEVARLCGLDKSKTLHYLYRTVEENLKVSVDGVKSFYKLNTGNEISTFETVIHNNPLYMEVVRLCEETIERKKAFG